MYTIIKTGVFKWLGIYMIQDGTQRFEESTRKRAIQKMVDCARTMNDTDITEADIEFGDEEASTDVHCVSDKVFSPGAINILGFALDDHSLNSIINIFAPSDGLVIAEFDSPGRKLTIGESAVAEIRGLRKYTNWLRGVLLNIATEAHACDCPGFDGELDCNCPVGVAQEALKKNNE